MDFTMKVYLDQQELDGVFPTVESALDAARTYASSNGRVIVDVHADGRQVADEQLDGLGAALIPAELRLWTADGKKLVHTAFSDLSELSGELAEVQARTAEHLQSGRFAEGMQGLDRIVTVWEQVRRGATEGTALLGKSLTDFHPDGLEPAKLIDALRASLLGLRGALRSEDWSTVSDILDEDLAVQAREWSHMLAAVADEISGSAA